MGREGGRDSSPEVDEVDDEVFTALVAPERRFALYYLLEHRSASVGELADVVVGWTGAGTRGMATREDWECTRTELLHSHVPRLRDVGLVEYDAAAGTVRLAIGEPTVVQVIKWAYESEGREGRE